VKCDQGWEKSLRVTRADSQQSDLACSKVSLIREERKVGANRHSPPWGGLVGISHFGKFRGGGPPKRNKRLNLTY